MSNSDTSTTKKPRAVMEICLPAFLFIGWVSALLGEETYDLFVWQSSGLRFFESGCQGLSVREVRFHQLAGGLRSSCHLF